MKRVRALILLMGTCISFNAHAWFFFFIPGSVTSSVSDAVTGAEGKHCVGERVKVGDTIRLSNDSLMTVKSLSGTSARCVDPNFPIRALLESRNSLSPANASLSSIATVATSTARLDLPDEWKENSLTDRLKAGRNVLYSTNRTRDTGLLLATVSRAEIKDTATYAGTRSAYIATLFDDAVRSPVKPLTINGASAWQFEISGKTTARVPVPIGPGAAVTVLQTVYEGSKEIMILNSWATTANYQDQKTELQRIANSLTGIAPDTVASTPPSTKQSLTAPQGSTEDAANASNSDVVNRLTVLKSLLDRGLITKEDYETKKQAILNSM